MLLRTSISRLGDGGGTGPRDEGPATDDEDARLAGRRPGGAPPAARPGGGEAGPGRDGAGPRGCGAAARPPRPLGLGARPAARMSRSRHLDLDTSDDAVILGAGARARHRATVEEQLAAALAAAIGSSSTPGPR